MYVFQNENLQFANSSYIGVGLHQLGQMTILLKRVKLLEAIELQA